MNLFNNNNRNTFQSTHYANVDNGQNPPANNLFNNSQGTLTEIYRQ